MKNEAKDYKTTIAARVKEHYDYLIAAGYDVVFTALQGSQNYGLDEYSNDYCSDVDTKSMILPSFDDFAKGKQPLSKVEILENKARLLTQSASQEHAEVKDVRVMFEMFKKENISYIELLYSDYIIINPEYEPIIKHMFDRRDEIATANIPQFLRCIAGMAYEKNKALCHPYPSIVDKIKKYGYDGKQLSHCYRLLEFIVRFSQGESIAACYKSKIKNKLMNYKKQLDGDGSPLDVERAKALSSMYTAAIKANKDKLIAEFDYGVNEGVWVFLDEIKVELLKMKVRKELKENTYEKKS